MKILVPYIIFIVCCGLVYSQSEKTERKCFRGKVLTFPDPTDIQTYVKLYPNETMDFPGATVCMRFYSDLNTGERSLFSLSTPAAPLDFSIVWSASTRHYQLSIHNRPVEFKHLSFSLNQWNSLCATYDGNTGLAQMFVNTGASVKKVVGLKTPFKGMPVIVLGQGQTTHGGGFKLEQAFTGFISDVHIHREILTGQQIKNYIDGQKFKLGDYVTWTALKHSISGSVQIYEKRQVTFYNKDEQS